MYTASVGVVWLLALDRRSRVPPRHEALGCRPGAAASRPRCPTPGRPWVAAANRRVITTCCRRAPTLWRARRVGSRTSTPCRGTCCGAAGAGNAMGGPPPASIKVSRTVPTSTMKHRNLSRRGGCAYEARCNAGRGQRDGSSESVAASVVRTAVRAAVPRGDRHRFWGRAADFGYTITSLGCMAQRHSKARGGCGRARALVLAKHFPAKLHPGC